MVHSGRNRIYSWVLHPEIAKHSLPINEISINPSKKKYFSPFFPFGSTQAGWDLIHLTKGSPSPSLSS